MELSLNCDWYLLCFVSGLPVFSGLWPATHCLTHLSLPLSAHMGQFPFTGLSVLVCSSLTLHLFLPSRGVPCPAEELRQNKQKISVHVWLVIGYVFVVVHLFLSYSPNFCLLWLGNSNPKIEESCLNKLYEMDAATGIINNSQESDTTCDILSYIKTTYYTLPGLQTLTEVGGR